MITQQEYQARRQTLASRLPSDAIALIPAAEEMVRNGDVHYPFRQHSDFYYLTGFNEPEALLLVTGGKKSTSILFNRPRNPLEEQWTGRRLGQEDALTQLGVDEAHSFALLDTMLPKYLSDRRTIYYPIGHSASWDKRILTAWKTLQNQVRRGIMAAESFFNITPVLAEMRLFKSEAEIACLRQAANISVAAHLQAMKACRHAAYEYELEAAFRHELIRRGCRKTAYESIVAGGNNACILHYTDNNHSLRLGDLVLIDAGGECENYAADITRVFPVSGQFSQTQKLIYELVLRAQKAGIDCVRPGRYWHEIQTAIVTVLTSGLVELGLLKGNVEELISNEAYRPFYMHNSGHWLGLDVHDAGQYKVNNAWRVLEPGMVLTVEPGLYIQVGSDQVKPQWWGIGVRIEDDILVTSDGYENLTGALPVECHEIEASMRD